MNNKQKDINLGHKFETKDSGKRVKYKSGMNRDIADNKTDYILCYMPMFKRWAELMTRGAVKYGKNNWKKANSEEELERFYSSAFRHFIQWISGEDDEDHAAATYFNIACVEYLKEKLKKKNE